MPQLGAVVPLILFYFVIFFCQKPFPGKFYQTFLFVFFFFCCHLGCFLIFFTHILCASCDFFTIFSVVSFFPQMLLFVAVFPLKCNMQACPVPHPLRPSAPVPPAPNHLVFSTLWLGFGSFMYFLSKCPKGILLQKRQSRLLLLPQKNAKKKK